MNQSRKEPPVPTGTSVQSARPAAGVAGGIGLPASLRENDPDSGAGGRDDHPNSVVTRPKRRSWPPKVRTAAAVIATAGLILLAASCGAGPSSTASGDSSSAGGATAHSTTSEKALLFARCVRSQGVSDFPDPDASGQFNKVTLAQLANSNPHYAAANHACQHLLPTPSVAERRNLAAQALEFSRCIRAHGVTDFPDPSSDGRIPDPSTRGIDQGSPRFQAANQACGRYRPPYMPSNAAYNAYARANGS
jgi:hypothetical protein